ncbi:DMT family transporter [Vibrio sp. Isolate23]|uniref:DMT family transporter n=1 Tax=Vibrio sp. Isolate23 TaxID=2908533 RepID=UPI001EFDF7FB|nr:DMT family transporter [Vibrio sp. Isolate23]MCG9681079.1 DMT family transporter [Vibrio sp. Isolate23]
MISGYLAMAATLLLWSGFFLSLRDGAHSDLTTADIALVRFLIPAIVLLPLVIKSKSVIKRVPKRYIMGMFLGCGLPYLLIVGAGMQLAPVSDGSALIPGTLPLFVSGIAVVLFKQPLSSHRILGLTLVVSGIAAFLYQGFSQPDSHLLKGYLLFLIGSLMWATFTICARVSSLNPLITAGFISLLSTLALPALIFSGNIDSYLFKTNVAEWPWKELAGHITLQGIGAGIVAAYTYLHAISVLGAERTAAFGAATPAIATLLAIVVFNEQPTVLGWFALGLICVGSLIASNVFMKQDASLLYQPPKFK